MRSLFELLECFERDVEAGEHAIAFHEEDPVRLLCRRDDCISRHVAVTNVFLERPAHQVAIKPGIERVHVSPQLFAISPDHACGSGA